MHGLVPVVAETYAQQGAAADVSYFSVAVVRKSFCDALGPSASLRSLQGRRSCHTGYRRTAGWTLPV